MHDKEMPRMSCMKVGEGDVQKVGQGDVQIMCLGRTSVIWVWNWPTQNLYYLLMRIVLTKGLGTMSPRSPSSDFAEVAAL